MTPTALLVGGTGPTGPHLARGLTARGYDVTLFHRGTHELEELSQFGHVHGDPHFSQTIAAALGERAFDVVIATYGRIRLLAEHFAGRCRHFVSIGGTPIYDGYFEPWRRRPTGMAIYTPEEAPLADTADGTRAAIFGGRMRTVEESVLGLHASGAFLGTHVRYPGIYGPRQVAPVEWSVVKRVLDNRPFIFVPDNGLTIMTRCAAPNAAEAVLRCIDAPEISGGSIYNAGDDSQYSLRQWIEIIADYMGASIDIVSVPDAPPDSPGWPMLGANHTSHCLLSTEKIRRELNYRDVVHPLDAVGSAVDWLRETPMTADLYPALLDPFAYADEDRLVALMTAVTRQAGELIAALCRPFTHPYPHPVDATSARDALGR